MADCNNTEVFLKEWKRMCDNNMCGDVDNGITCPIEEQEQGRYSWCYHFIKNCPVEAIKIVQKWSDEHSKKTRQSEFLKMFPNAVTFQMGDHKIVALCPIGTDVDFRCHGSSKLCADCQKEYWMAEVE